MIKTFFGTTVFRLVVLLAGWLYMTNMQADVLYRFFDMTNPATQAVVACHSGFASAEESITTKLDLILSTLQENTTGLQADISTGVITISSTGDFNDIVFSTGSNQ